MRPWTFTLRQILGKRLRKAVRLADIGVKAERLQLKHQSIRELSEEVEEDSNAG